MTPNFKRKTNLILQHALNGRIGIGKFESELPRLAQQIRMDSLSSCFSFWGQSYNFDEFENARIVDRKLLTVIGKLANYLIRDGSCYHAGLIHTYGYLLSNLRTRFGYKRERWTDGKIETAFGIPTGTLLGSNDDSTLLQNVTYLMAKVSFTGKKQFSELRTLDCVSDKVKKIKFEKLRITRIQEQVQIGRRKTPLKLFTDLVEFGKSSPINHLVVYSYQQNLAQKLVTCFAMNEEGKNSLVAAAKANVVEVQPRFNLAFRGFSKPGKHGSRKVAKRRACKL